MMKNYVRNREILRMAREKGKITRGEVADVLGVSMPTATALFGELLSEGLLINAGYDQSAGGRPAALFGLSPGYMYAVGVECSLLGTEAVLTDMVGKVSHRRRAETPKVVRPEAMVEVLCELVGSVLSAHEGKCPSGIGVGISGLVDRKRGVSVQFPRAEGGENVRVGEILRERFGLPVFVENDVQAATLAHLRFGLGRGIRHFLYLHIGQGIRLGIVAKGKLYEGASGQAGEVGHVVVAPEGPVCHCGNYGCLESLAGPAALVSQAREAIAKGVESPILSLAGGRVEEIGFRTILEAAAQGDRLAGNLLEKAGQHIGLALANIANVLEPEMLIAGGIQSDLLRPLVEVITGKFRTAAMPGVRDRVRVELSNFDRFPCSLGAGTLVLEDFFEREWSEERQLRSEERSEK